MDKESTGPVLYWKIAPGRDGYIWNEFLDESIISIGYGRELGDLDQSWKNKSESERKKAYTEARVSHSKPKRGFTMLQRFYDEVKKNHVVIAASISDKAKKIFGIGVIKTGKYLYNVSSKEEYYHAKDVDWIIDKELDIPKEIRWNQQTVHRVYNDDWQNVKAAYLESYPELKENFELLEKEVVTPPLKSTIDLQYSFSEKTFEILSKLHNDPTYDFYIANKDALRNNVIKPFKQFMMAVQEILRLETPELLEKMETEKRVFANILKQFAKQGCWDFYWGAFYPKGGKRTHDAQLFMWINQDRLEFGFYIGEYGSNQRNRFLRNCQENYEVLKGILRDGIVDSNILFGERSDFVGGSKSLDVDKKWPSFDDWLKNPTKEGIHAAIFLSKEEVLQRSSEQLVKEIADVYQRLFPFVLLATLDDPMPAIGDYLGQEEEMEINPDYSLDECSKATGFNKALLKSWVRAINRKGQAILYGPPGTGKTYLAELLAKHLIGGDDGFYDIVQFHPAYAYEDFMQGIRPRCKDNGQLDYPLVPGQFLKFCKKAKSCKGRCVLIIDEINRTNLARVFGELMYLLEYRDREASLASGSSLRIPNNVRLIGTMNTADRSIALVDHALRRRFAFLALYPNYDVLRHFHQENNFNVGPLIDVLNKLNMQIGNRHYEVGITFFLHNDLPEKIEDIWRMEIEPYLEEYFFDQPDKVDEFRWKKVKTQIFPR